ncbi:MAG TPA: hypothetical protein VER37_11020 [Thermomicrobiales bacterium]|nr:hypothetical protein [Thermomicrobiales bacterium]
MEDAETRQRVEDLFAETPPPPEYDLCGGDLLPKPRDPGFTPLRLDPYRVQGRRFGGEGTTCRRGCGGATTTPQLG